MNFLIGPLRWLEGSYELGSVLLSVLLSGSFLGIGSLVFSETHHGVRGHVLLCMAGLDFF